MKIFTIFLVFIVNSVLSQEAFAEKTGDFTELRILREILEKNENRLDLAKIKLTVDKLIDPSINVDLEMNKINRMTANIKSMLKPDANAMDKMLAIKKYIYTAG